MNTIGERIKTIREAKDLSQEAFGAKLGVMKTTVSGWENGRRQPGEATLKSIMREWNVSYSYLTEGKGDMFDDLPETLLDELADEYHLTDIQKKLVKTFLELDDEQKDALTTLLEKTFTK